MGILKDIMDTVRDIDVNGSLQNYFEKKKYSSIAKQSQEGTLQFPVIFPRSLDIDILQIVSKAIERQLSSFTQIVLTMNPILNIDTEKDMSMYLRKFHQNSDTKTDTNDIQNFLLDMDDVRENYTLYADEHNTIEIMIGLFEGLNGSIKKANREDLEVLSEHLRLDILNNKFIPRNINIYKMDSSIVTEAKNKKHKKSNDDVEEFKLPNKVLLDSDVKKSNELIPTMLHLKLKIVNKDGVTHGTHEYLIGVKAMIHPVSSDEMVSNVVGACRNDNRLFDFIRWTSGETNFLKDFIFNIQEIKGDIKNREAGSSSWWIALKRRKALSKIKNTLLLGNQLLPNATLVLSMQEADFIKSQYGYDLMSPVFVNKVMSTYFLLGFVIVDTSSQLAHFLFDGQNSYQTTTFIGLERESGSDERKFKEMLKLINRV